MRAAIFSSTPIWEIHNAQMLEKSLILLSNHNDLIAYHCLFATFSCRINPRNEQSRCLQCVLQSKRNKKVLLPKAVRNVWIKKSDFVTSINLPKLENHQQLADFYFLGFPFGRATISQLQTMHKQTRLESEIIMGAGLPIVYNAIQLFFYFRQQFIKERIDKAIVFGGRYAAERSLTFAAKSLNLKFETFETGSQKNKVWTSEIGETSFDSYIVDVLDTVTASDERKQKNLMQIGRNYLDAWMDGSSTDPNYLNPNLKRHLQFNKSSFEDVNKEGKKKKKKIVVFTSTDFEVMAFDDFAILGSSKNTQQQVLHQLNNSFSLLEKYQIIVRWHPNSLLASSRDQKEIRKCIEETGRLLHIDPSSEINSYSLIEDCEAVLVFGSSIGIEVASRGKIVFLLAKASYSGIGAAIEPKSFRELEGLLQKLPQSGTVVMALLWAYWRATFGETMKNVVWDTTSGGYFLNGKRVLSPYLRLVIRGKWMKHKIKQIVLTVTK